MISNFPISVSGNWSEDFSNGFENWNLWAEDWRDKPKEIDHTWEVIDGELVSAGLVNSEGWNRACREIGLANGTWSFDHYWPSTSSFGYITDISLGDKVDYRQVNPEEGPFSYFAISLTNANPRWSMDNVKGWFWEQGNSSAIKTNTTFFDDFVPEGWQQLRIERGDRFILYVNDVEFVSLPGYHDYLDTLNSLCLVAGVGIKVKFDNVVADADPNISNNDDNPVNFGIVTLSILLSTVLIRKTKKRSMY